MKKITGIIVISGFLLFYSFFIKEITAAQESAPSETPKTVKVVVYGNPYPGKVTYYNEKGKRVKTVDTGMETTIERGRYNIVVTANRRIFSYWRGEVDDYDFKVKWAEKYEFSPKQKKIIRWMNIFWVVFLPSIIIGGISGYSVLKRMKDLKMRLQETSTKTDVPEKKEKIPRKIHKYSVIEKLGQGGMAVVYKVRDDHGDIYALKVPHTHIFDVPEFKKRFMREVEIIKTLHHPNIVRMYDFDLSEQASTPYICFEYVEGKSLKDFMMKNPILPVKKAAEIATAIASALGYAHSKGITHRDVKPENVMLTRKQQVKLMDLGIARAMKFKTLTATGTTLGTPQYIAPEQVARTRKDIDGRADLYSLGIILYEMVTAKIPFDDEEPMMVIMMHIAEQPPPPRTHNALIPEDLENIILKLLEKNPANRFQSAGELIEALKKFL